MSTHHFTKLLSVRSLEPKNCDCGEVAIIEAERTNKGLPKPYIQDGTRYCYYCREHVPADVRAMWNFVLEDPQLDGILDYQKI